MVVYNAVANRWRHFHGWAYVPLNLALAAAVVATGALVFGMDRRAMGLRWESGWIGAVIGVAAMVPVYALLGSERGRGWLRDQRLADVRGANVAFMLVIRIPVGTALVEEIVFRGVLLGSLLPRGEAFALSAMAVAFGLWHVVPTAILAKDNRLPRAVIPGGVVLTGLAGVVLGWMRIRTGSVAAPLLLHAAVNSLGAGAALIALRRPFRPR